MTVVELTSFRDDESGVWHAHDRGAERALCGAAVPRFKPGRRRAPSCETCVAEARALPVEVTPVFWGWQPPLPAAPAQPPVSMVKADPPLRADGRCAVCGKPRKTDRSQRYARGEAERDPFCSTQCCKAYHGIIDRFAADDEEPEEIAA